MSCRCSACRGGRCGCTGCLSVTASTPDALCACGLSVAHGQPADVHLASYIILRHCSPASAPRPQLQLALTLSYKLPCLSYTLPYLSYRLPCLSYRLPSAVAPGR
mmetsp:Transcript_31225/g.69456  ORF Transcript_31225/g.69456 Transcript_31225/m.69456 type:complete len:105 (+) Transcript_31225:77-391(+)